MQFIMNFQGLAPVDPFVNVPTGVYPVDLGAITENVKDGKKSARFDVAIADGQYAGAPQQLYLGVDGEKEFIRRQWKTLFLSAGAPAPQLEGTISIDTDKLIHKRAYIFVQAAPAGSDEYDDRSFITKAAFDRMKSLNTATPVGAVATGAQTSTATPGFTPTTPQPTAGANSNVAAALNF